MDNNTDTHVEPHAASTEQSVQLEIDGIQMVRLLGPQDRFLTRLEKQYPKVRILVRGNTIVLSGPQPDLGELEQLIRELLLLVRTGYIPDEHDFSQSQTFASNDAKKLLGNVIVSSRGKHIRAQTAGQKAYVDAIDHNTIVFGIGPAGTGKTYLAMAKAVQALQAKQVNRIILTRPAVEAGERLGFLPGTLTDKIDPYLRPLYDALNEMLEPELVPKLLAAGTIEVAPLAYMRGRTLNDSFILLDEAQNTTPEQMKMFLTRLGWGSHIVVTGDITQLDRPGEVSGLRLVTNILSDVEDIHFAYLGQEDIVRHTLVERIVNAYSHFEEERVQASERKQSSRVHERSVIKRQYGYRNQ